jgi:hypothetical protein
MSKIYAKLSLTEDELTTVSGAVSASRARLFDKWGAAPAGPEKEFYSKLVDKLDSLTEKLRKPLEDDRSQDAETDDDDDDDDNGVP